MARDVFEGSARSHQIAVWVVGAMVIGLFALWFGYFRLRFRDEVNRALRRLPAFRDFQNVTATPLGGGLTNRTQNGGTPEERGLR